VLIEASALGVPIAAMDTGGTRDIIEPDVTGLLSTSPKGLAADVRRLRNDAALRERLGSAARAKVEREFDADVVVARVHALYEELVSGANERQRVPASAKATARPPKHSEGGSHANGAGPAAPASERVRGGGGAKPPGQE
jgi:hypothetical protein